MLIVGRVEVGHVRLRVGGVDRLAVHRGTGAVDEIGQPQREVVVAARRPLLQVGHLHARGGVHAVGRLHQRGERDGLEHRREIPLADGLPDGVHPLAVLRLDVAGVDAEGLREVAGARRHTRELVDEPGGGLAPLSGVGLHVATRQRGREREVIVGRDEEPRALERLAHAGGAAEEIERALHPPEASHRCDDGVDQEPLAAQVLDHRPAMVADSRLVLGHNARRPSGVRWNRRTFGPAAPRR